MSLNLSDVLEFIWFDWVLIKGLVSFEHVSHWYKILQWWLNTYATEWTNQSIPIMRVVLQAMADSSHEFKSMYVNSTPVYLAQWPIKKIWVVVNDLAQM